MTPSPPTLGILGAGQLALMLRDAAFRLGILPWVFSPSREAPAARSYSRVVVGQESDPVALQDFLPRCSVVIFENEFVDTHALERGAASLHTRFFPSLEAMALLQEKLGQKKTLDALKIPTAPWIERPTGVEVTSWLAQVAQELETDLVLKWSKHGYDGKGVLVVSTKAALKPHPEDPKISAAIEFCKKADQNGIAVFAESKVDFRRELAILACASLKGEISTYPLVVSTQVEGVCDTVVGPARSLGVSSRLEKLAQTYAQKLARKTGLRGCFALELFETQSGKLLVNEIAPRVHNSAHYTQDASETSQFENQVRAALGLSTGSTESAPAFGMVNLLGPKGLEKTLADTPELPPLSSELHFHWYGKKELRPGRKLGHLNAAGSKASEIGKLERALQKERARWYRSLR